MEVSHRTCGPLKFVGMMKSSTTTFEPSYSWRLLYGTSSLKMVEPLIGLEKGTFHNIEETLVGEGLWTSRNLIRVGNTMRLFANAMLKE